MPIRGVCRFGLTARGDDARNGLKHLGGSDSIGMDLGEEAVNLIDRAIRNKEALVSSIGESRPKPQVFPLSPYFDLDSLKSVQVCALPERRSSVQSVFIPP
jgi:hypothetical protein